MGGGIFHVHFPFPDFPIFRSQGGVSCEEFGVDKGAGGGGVDVVHNQGVWGRGVHGLVMMVHKSVMSDVS